VPPPGKRGNKQREQKEVSPMQKGRNFFTIRIDQEQDVKANDVKGNERDNMQRCL